ncbi:MAG: MazG nucleotide pyrophosphohydrolase domain-containing protein [Planctomycetota bacterium]
MDIDALQTRVRELVRGIEHPRSGAAIALAEECGEVMRCVLDSQYYGHEDDGALQAEVGDVLIALAELCDRFGLSLDACAESAVAKLARKAPAWREQLGPRLRELRRRMDG